MSKVKWLSLLSVAALTICLAPNWAVADDTRVTTVPAVYQLSDNASDATVQLVHRGWGGGYRGGWGGGYRGGWGGGYRGGWGGGYYYSYRPRYYGGYYGGYYRPRYYYYPRYNYYPYSGGYYYYY